MDLHNKKILIVKLSSLGDIIHALPVLSTLKMKFPNTQIDWIVDDTYHHILQENPFMNHVWIFPRRRWKEWGRLFRDLRRQKYDVAIDLQGLIRSALITKLSGATLKVGFSNPKEKISAFFYNLKKPVNQNSHAIDRYLDLLSLLNIEEKNIGFPLPLTTHPLPFKLSKEPYYVVVPGARWQSKKWPVSHFIEVIQSLRKTAVIVGSESDIEDARSIYSKTTPYSLNLAGKTNLFELTSIIHGAQFILTNDTGPMHIAAAFSIPTFSFFGPTSEKKTGPYGNIHTVFNAHVSCSPCFKKKCFHKDDQKMMCMKKITPQQVIQKLK